MESDTEANKEKSKLENSAENKQEHIKQRLKDLGVSDDSDRPKKSWFSRYGNYLMATIIISLGFVYWFEYKNQENQHEPAIAQTNVTTARHSSNMNPNNIMSNPHQRMNTPYMTAEEYHAQWQQKQVQYRRAMQAAWQAQQMRRLEWEKRQREQQVKAWQDWQKYIKQQQNNNQYNAKVYQGWQQPQANQPFYLNNPNYNRW